MRKRGKILPPTYFLSGIVLTLLIHFLIPFIQIIEYPFNLLGLIPLIISGILNIAADNALKKFNTTVKPFEASTALVTTGVYRISRNPMYLGMFLFILGESIILGSIGSFVIPILFIIVINKRFISTEEKMLASEFREKYLSYCKVVRRWI
ncbi:MAG TPA: isoprenylcysteine carboxylmethyltransferase family protein [Melioribacteraceae bacterium]|nr:isoprenylcysteine carboxylmethyltransferase family protein [Melioribacteraceae bacterium]